jgi:hypothetical protein
MKRGDMEAKPTILDFLKVSGRRRQEGREEKKENHQEAEHEREKPTQAVRNPCPRYREKLL